MWSRRAEFSADSLRLLEAEQEVSFRLAATCVLASVASVCMWCVCVSTLVSNALPPIMDRCAMAPVCEDSSKVSILSFKRAAVLVVFCRVHTEKLLAVVTVKEEQQDHSMKASSLTFYYTHCRV